MQELLKKYGIDNQQMPFDIAELCKKMGFVVGNLVCKDSDENACFLIASPELNNGEKTIGVASNYHIFYKRFLIAFMLANFFINNEKSEDKDCDKFLIRIKEKDDLEELYKNEEILEFVMELLLPYEKIEEELNSKNGLLLETIIVILASKYRVPEFLVKDRLVQIIEKQSAQINETSIQSDKRISYSVFQEYH